MGNTEASKDLEHQHRWGGLQTVRWLSCKP